MDAFAGWDMPASFGDAVEEHGAVRSRAGLFDLGHTGFLELAGNDVLPALQWLTSNDASRLKVGEVQHSALTTAEGTFFDQLLVFRLAARHFLLAVNPQSLGNDARWILAQAPRFGDVAVVDTSSRYAALSLQGPASQGILQALTGADLEGLGDFSFTYGEVAGARATISRTVCTGEDGFDVLVPPQSAVRTWQAILTQGADAGLVPAGLQALDTLRLEAGWRRYGADIDEATSVLEAGLESIVAWGKGDFCGRAVLAAQRDQGPSRRLVGFEMVDAVVALPGCDTYAGGAKAGAVTSGAESPSMKKPIGLAYLPASHGHPGAGFEVEVNGRRAMARVVGLPFYKRSKG